MTRTWMRVLSASAAGALVAGLLVTAPAAADDPVGIDAVVPPVTAATGTISVTGHGFSATASENVVRLNGTALTVTSATATALTATVPAGVTSGPVTVQSPAGSATSASDVYIPPTGFTPADVETYQRAVFGTAATAVVGTSGRISLLTVPGAAGHRISVKLATSTFGSSTSNARVALYRPDGVAAIAPTGFATAGLFLEPYVMPLDGTYQILVDPQGTAVGQVAVTVYDLPADPAAPLAAGTPLTLATTVPGQNATATFTGTTGQRRAFQFSAGTFGSSSYAYITVKKPDGTALVSSTACGTSCWIDTKVLPADGTYTVLLDPQTSQVGALTVQMTDVPADATSTLVPGTSLTMTTTVAGQNAVASFAGVTNQRVALKFSAGTFGSSSNAYVTVRKPDGTSLVSSTACGTSCWIDTKVLPVDGTYTVFLDPQNWYAGSLTVDLTDVPADATSALVPGTSLTMTTTVAGQNAVASFAGVTNQRVALKFTAGTFGSSSNAYVTVKKPDGTVLVSSTACGTSCWIDTKVLPVDGTYTVLLDPQNWYTGSLTVDLTSVPADATSALVPGTPQTLTTTTAGQNAVATFTGATNQRVALRFSGGTYGSSSNAYVTVKKPDGTVLVSSTACGTSCWIDTKVLPADGTYTVLLDPQNWYTGSLTAQLFDVPADPVLTATVGGPGVPVATTTPGQNAKVTFTATTGQRVSVQIAGSTYGSSSSSVYASVLKPDGTTLVSSTGVGSGGVLLGPVTITADGVHTIVLDPSTDLVGGVTVTVNDTADATVATTVGGAPVTAATTTAGQNATVTFPVTDGARVAVKLTASTYGSSSGSLYASLLKPDGSVLVAATGVGSGGLFIDARLLSPAGTYKVLLDPQGALTGSVQVEVIGVPADVTAVAALDGSVTHVATTVAGQNAAVTFTGTAGQRVSTLLSNGTGSIYATISKPDGTDLYARWYAGSGSFADVVTLPADGAYTIKLDPSTVSLGTMDVQVWSVPADPSAVAAPDGTVATVAMAVPGQNGSVTVAGTAGQRFSFRLSGSVGVYATVKKPDGTDLYARWYASTSSFADPVTLPATGTYTVLLDPSGSATGSYSVQVYTVPADPAYAVGTDGTPVTASMGVPGQNASVTFSGTAGQRLSLLLSGTVSVYATVTRPDGTNLYNRWYAGTSSFTEPVVLPATGTYTILIDPSGSATGTTDVRAYTVPADVSVDIGQDGTPVTVSTGAPGQNGRATFTGAAGRRVYLKAEMLGTYKGSATVSLRDPANTSLTSSTVYGPTGSVVLGPVTLSAGGTFSLLVDPSTTSTGVMQLRLWDATPAPAVAATIGGPAVTVGTGVPGQSGLATFTGTAGQKVSAVVSAPTYAEDGAAAAFNGWLLGPTGTTLDSDYSYGSAMLLTATLPADGTYTVNARPVGLAVGTAQVRIYEIPADPVVAAVIGGGHFVLPIAVPGAGAVAAFTATAGQPIVLDLVDSPAEAYAVVTRPDGVTLCSGYVSVYSQLSCTAGAAGEYRARVTLYTADSGDVTLELVDGIGTPDIRSVIAGEWLGGDVSLEWSTTASVSIAGYAVTIDDSPATDPGTAVTQVQDYLDTVLGDGVHYVHVRAIATSGYAGPAGHLEIKVDATAPAAPVVAVPSHPDPDTGVASLAVHAQFTGTDATSGIAGYAVTVTHGADDEPLGGADATADYTTTLSAEGEWYLHVVAVDRAGNRSAAVHRRLTADMPPDAPRVTSPTHPVAGTAYAGQDFVATWQPGTADADRWAVVLDHSATTVPAVTSTSAETRFGAHLAGGTWWLHVRGVDTAGTPGATAHFEVVVAPQTLAFTAPLPGRVVWGAVPVTLDCPAGSALTVQARAAGGTWYPVGTAAESAGVCATTWTTTDAGWADGAYELRASDGTTVVVGGLNVTVTNASNVVDRIRFDYEAGALDMVNYVRYTLYAIVNPAAVPARYTDGAAELNETSGVLQALVGLFGELPAAVQDELRPWLSPTPADPPAGVQGGRSSARAKLLSNPDCGFWNRVGDVLFSCKATTAHFTVYYLEDNVGGTPPGKTRPDYVQTAMDNLEGARTAYQSNLGYRVPDHVEVIMHPVASWMHSGVSVPSFPLCGCGDGIMYLNEHANDIKDLVRHELFHFVQYEYISHLKAANNWMNWWMEATAEWGAHQAGYYAGEMGQDDSYYQSLDDFLKESDERFDEGNTVFQQGGPEYGAFIMAEFMEVRLGMDSIRWSWERLGGLFPPHPGDVIEELFNTMRVNGSFADEIERFRQWVYPVESFQSPVGFYDSDAHDWRGSLSSLPGFRPPHKLVTLNPDGGSIQLARGDLHIQQTGAQYVEVSNPNKFSTELGVTFAADDEDVRASILLLDENTFPSAACGDVTPVDGVQGTIVTLTAQCPNAVVVFVNTEAAGWWGTWSDGDYTLTYVRQSIDLSGVSDIGVGKYGNISSANGVGLRRHGQPDTESILNGCYCEGWGVGVPGQFGASVTDELGWKNMSLDSFTVNGPNTVTSIIDIPGGGLQVVQTTSPSSVGFLWAMRVTVFNTTSAPIGPVHYRRAVDWDPLPDLFQSYNTVQKIAGTDTTYVAGVSNDGFADPDPSFPMTDLGATGWFTDFGPDDTGALIDLNLGTLQPGEGKPFTIFYGTATSEAEAISGAQAAGAQVYSLGEVDTPQGRNQGLPYTPVMAVDGHSLNPAPLHALRSIPADGKTPAQTFLPTLPGTRPPHQGGA